jgi:hypothetical protein
MIGLGGVDLDAILPLSGGLADARTVGEVEEDRPRGVHEFRDAGSALVGVQREVGCEGAGQRVFVGVGQRVADVAAGDQWRETDEPHRRPPESARTRTHRGLSE